MNGDADGGKDFTLKCKPDGTFSAVPKIRPIECGKAAERDHAKGDGFEHICAEHAHFSCNAGYTVDAFPLVESLPREGVALGGAPSYSR